MLRESRLSYLVGLILVVIALGAFSRSTRAATADYSSFDVPGASYTLAIGINNSGEVVGFYGVCGAVSQVCVEQGFLRNKDGSIISINVPGAGSTNAYDISDSGEIVGTYFDSLGQHGFLFTRSREFQSIDYPDPNTCQTVALGINSRGQVVGYYDKSAICDGPDFVFVREPGGSYATIPNPFSNDSAQANGLNPMGQIVGTWLDESAPGNPQERSFLLNKDGTAISLSYPGAADTVAFGINPQGMITGFYLNQHLNTFGPGHGFLRDRDGVLTQLRYPAAVKTLVGKINAPGEFVGGYAMADGVIHGFVARLTQ